MRLEAAPGSIVQVATAREREAHEWRLLQIATLAPVDGREGQGSGSGGSILRTSSKGKYSVRSLVAMIPAAQMSAFLPIWAGAFASISGAMLAMFPMNLPAPA